MLSPCLRDLSMGNDFLCYIDQSGKLFCRGELAGFGAPNDCLSGPVEIEPTITFRSLDAGFAAACAITTSDDLWCWGGDAHQMITSPAACSRADAGRCRTELGRSERGPATAVRQREGHWRHLLQWHE